jgi:hypothetical protein
MMDGWDWAWMLPMMLLWLMVLAAIIYAAVRLANRDSAPPSRPPRLTMHLALGGAAVVAAVIATVALASVTAPAGQHPPTDCSTQLGAHLASTRGYRLVLRIGPVEDMFMPYQVRASHPKHGEVMLHGRMVMPTRGPLDHLEVHICTKNTRGRSERQIERHGGRRRGARLLARPSSTGVGTVSS